MTFKLLSHSIHFIFNYKYLSDLYSTRWTLNSKSTISTHTYVRMHCLKVNSESLAFKRWKAPVDIFWIFCGRKLEIQLPFIPRITLFARTPLRMKREFSNKLTRKWSDKLRKDIISIMMSQTKWLVSAPRKSKVNINYSKQRKGNELQPHP